MAAVHPRGGHRSRIILLTLLLVPSSPEARPKPSADVPPPPGPVIVSLEAVPAPSLRGIRARAVIRTGGLGEAATVSLSVGASAAWGRVEPGTGDVTVERDLPLTRAKPWSPARPVRFLLIAGVTRRSVPLDRRGIRFALRTLDLADGRLRLNGAPFQVRGASRPPGGDASVGALRALRAAGYNAILFASGDRTAASHDACDAAGLLALDEVPAPGPSLVHLRPGAMPSPDPASVAVFGTATAFAEAARAALAERFEAALALVRRDPAHPGFLLETTSPPDLVDRFGNRSLAVTPPPAFALPGAAAGATITLGAGPWPADTVLEWRFGGDGPWSPVPHGGPRLTPGAIRVLPLPDTGQPGRRSAEIRARSGPRTLATDAVGWRVTSWPATPERSFALLGAAPALRAAFPARIIPPDTAAVIVAVHPAMMPDEQRTVLFDALDRGRTVVFLELDVDDVTALTAHPRGCWTLNAFPVDAARGSHLTWIRPGPIGAELPGTGVTERQRWFAGPAYLPLLPTLALRPLPGATIEAGESPVGPDQPALAGLQSVAAGPGRAVFCQWRVLDALPDPLARLVFERLLGL